MRVFALRPYRSRLPGAPTSPLLFRKEDHRPPGETAHIPVAAMPEPAHLRDQLAL